MGPKLSSLDIHCHLPSAWFLELTTCKSSHVQKLPLPSSSEMDRAKKSLDERILLSSVQRIDAIIERVLAQPRVTWKYDDRKALRVVTMVHDIGDVT
jgi:hypothetical protein